MMDDIAHATGNDIYVEIQQSTVDKLLASVQFPFQVLERRQDFPGCSSLAAIAESGFYQYSKEETRTLLSSAVAQVRRRVDPHPTGLSVADQIYSFGGGILEQAKRVLDIASTSQEYEGPAKSELQDIVDGGIEGLAETLGDFGLFAWNPYLRVVVKSRPTVSLSSPRIDLDGVRIEVTATGELWAQYPWWNCYRWCTKWEKVRKCDRVARLTVSPDIAADAHATVSARSALVIIKGAFDRLRLDYDILREIPLEDAANAVLKDKLVYVYDASQLIATVPMLQSRFSVEKISLPPHPSGIGVGVTLRQI